MLLRECEDESCTLLGLHGRRADRLAGAASVDADGNMGSKKGCICELQLLQYINTVC